MGKIISNEERNRPRITCANCKRENQIDIRGWNKDVTQIGKIKCKGCQREMFVALLILANTTVEALGQNVQQIVESMGAKNTLRIGENAPKTILKN